MNREVRLTVGELREMLGFLSEDTEVCFGCRQAAEGRMGFHRLCGAGGKLVRIDLDALDCQGSTALAEHF